MQRFLPLVTVFATALALAGCGSSDNAIWVSGKLLKGGTAYTAPEGQRIGVTLYSIESADGTAKEGTARQPYVAQFNAKDSTFTVPGPDGWGIPPGKYRIAVIQKATPGALPAPKKGKGGKLIPFDRETDFLKNRYSPTNSPIVRELKSSSDLSIDLDNPYDGQSKS